MKVLALALALSLLAGCSGLPDPREMGDMALIRTLGADAGEDGVSLTAATGPRPKGLQGEGQAALVAVGAGDTPGEAAMALRAGGEDSVFLGYADQLLVGAGALAGGLLPGLLDWFARDSELGLGARLWVVRGDARAAVESGGDRGLEGRLTTLITDSRLGTAPLTQTAGEVYAHLLDRAAAWAPVLRAGEGGVAPDGYAVILKEGAVAGYLTGGEARGLELLAGQPRAHLLGAMGMTARVYRSTTLCRFDGEGTLHITCRVWARLAEYAAPPDKEALEAMKEGLRRQEEACVRTALARLREWGTDCLGLGAKAGLTAPALWQELAEDWSGEFARREPELTVKLELVR